jgi:hypothetical protein
MPIRPPASILSPLLLERDRSVGAIGSTIRQTFAAADVGCVGKAGEVDKLVYFFLEGLPLIEDQFMDEICGRSSFIAANVWQKRYSRENREAIGDVREYILVYAKTPEKFKNVRNRVPITEEQAKVYKNPNNDPRGRWRGIPMTAQGYYKLAPSLLTQDKWGQWIISKEYNAPMLAEAVCKHENFTYAPSDTVYWQQGRSTERDFIYTTTATLSHEQLRELSDEVGPERTLLVVCSAFRGRKESYPNLTIKKIPAAVLTRCEWGHDDYSLKVENLPKAPPPAPKTDAKTGQDEFVL